LFSSYIELDPGTDDFLILACDGLWDVYSSQQAVDYVREKLSAMPQNEQDPEKVHLRLFYGWVSVGQVFRSRAGYSL